MYTVRISSNQSVDLSRNANSSKEALKTENNRGKYFEISF